MKKLPHALLVTLCCGLYACVTVNVYFPAAAVEQAADRIVKEVYGVKAKQMQEQKTPAAEPGAKDKSGSNETPLQTGDAAGVPLSFLVRCAYAQSPDIDINTPAISRLKGSMQARHQQLVPFYGSGAVGLGANGLLFLRDAKAVSLKDRSVVEGLVADENVDRNALYAEIAGANGHPEWEREIRTIFDRRWVANAPGGWWFQDAQGNWVQK